MENGLEKAIKSTILQVHIKGIPLGDAKSPSTHQQFVNDTLLMGQPTTRHVENFKAILNDFAKSLGIDINLAKSQFFFVIPLLPFKIISQDYWVYEGAPLCLNTLFPL